MQTCLHTTNSASTLWVYYVHISASHTKHMLAESSLFPHSFNSVHMWSPTTDYSIPGGCELRTRRSTGTWRDDCSNVSTYVRTSTRCSPCKVSKFLLPPSWLHIALLTPGPTNLNEKLFSTMKPPPSSGNVSSHYILGSQRYDTNLPATEQHSTSTELRRESMNFLTAWAILV